MPKTIQDRRAAFRALHESGCFVLPNPWDLGSVRRLEKLGFKALASTSAGMAWTLGLQDMQVALDEVLRHLRFLVDATDLPINADFEAGFADTADGVATNVGRAVETGIAGLSIEDRVGNDLYPTATAVERIRAARAAIDRSGGDALLVARSEGYLVGKPDLRETIARLVAYSEAGADCLYAPALREAADIKAVVEAVAPKPVNVLMIGGVLKVEDLAALGVRRISTGGALAAAAWSAFDAAARQLAEQGTMPPRAKM